MLVAAKRQQRAGHGDGHGVVAAGRDGGDARRRAQPRRLQARDGLWEGDGQRLRVGALHHGHQLRVAQLAARGVAPGEDLAVCRQRYAVRAPRRHRHDALVTDGLHQLQQALVVEVAVAQLQPRGDS